MFSVGGRDLAPMREAGIDEVQVHRLVPRPSDRGRPEALRWSDDKLGGIAHVDWKPFDHPQLGKVEIGGWNRFHAFRNPPPQLLEREIARFPKWLLWQALISPKLELVARGGASALGDDTWRVRLVVQNTGWLPSYVIEARARAQGRARRRSPRSRCRPGAKLRHGQARARTSGSSKARRTSTPASRSGRITT